METSSLHVFRGLNCNKRTVIKERTELHAQNQMGRMEAVSRLFRLFHPLAETDRGLIQVSAELQYGQAA